MPASGNYVLNKGKAAGGAIAKKRFVKLDTSEPETVVQCDSAGENAYGVSMFTVTTDEIDLGKGCTVQVEGRAVVESGTTGLEVGQFVTTDNQGRAVVAGTGSTILGVCDQRAADVGDECSVVLSMASGAISAGS